MSYQGLGGINTASLGADDLSLTRGSTAYTLTLVDVTLVSGRTVARYRVNPRASGWTAADNGSYTLRVNANSIRGADGTYATARTLATFTAVRG